MLEEMEIILQKNWNNTSLGSSRALRKVLENQAWKHYEGELITDSAGRA
jgi:hypothetical protein